MSKMLFEVVFNKLIACQFKVSKIIFLTRTTYLESWSIKYFLLSLV